MNGPDRSTESDDLALSLDALGMLFDHVEEVVLCCAADGTLRFASRSARSHLGYDPRAVLGRNLVDFVHPDDRRRVRGGLRRWSGRSGAPTGDVIRVRASDGAWRRMRYDAVMGEPVGTLGPVVVTLRAVEGSGPPRPSYRHRMIVEDRLVRLASLFLEYSVDDFDNALHHALEELAALERVTRASVYLADGADRVRLRAMWQAQADAPGVTLRDRSRLSDFHMLRELAANREVHMTIPWSHGMEMARERDLFERAGLRSLLAVPMATDERFVGFVMLESTVGDLAYDATHANTLRSAAAIFTGAVVRHEAEMRLAAQARTDRVTGLGNRWAFDQALEDALADVASGASPGFGLALLDLDRFKVVNDSLGHAAGDRLLRDVASRLRSAVDVDTVVARLGGDELLVLADRSPDPAASEERIARLVGALAPPFDVGGQAMTVTASVGLVHAADASVGAGELLRRADVAMYRAKALGGDALAVDDPRSRARDGSRLWREAELRAAVGGEGIVVFYQGEWDLVSGELLGAEALVRWRHPTDGLLPADAFVPLAEEAGLIDDLGSVVLHDACRDAAAWSRARGAGRFVLRVNLAADQLRRVDLPSRVLDLLRDTGLPPESLCLELTESSLLVDPAGAATLFEELRDQGVGLAIDDFGTGYSSILQLKRLPVTSLKIDRSFVTGLPEDETDRAIVRATVQLADALGVTVTAEGVETPAQRQALVDLGCHRAQGYLLARPEPAASFATRVLASLD